MKLIIGGAYQGKRRFAKEKFGTDILFEDFHLYVLDLVKKGEDPVSHFRKNLKRFKDKIIICDDISCGIVPVDPIMRNWREALGHTLSAAVSECDEVFRVFCGIGTKIK